MTEPEFWDVAIIDGEPVTLRAHDGEQLNELRGLVNSHPEEVQELVRGLRESQGQKEGVVLWIDQEHLKKLRERRSRPVPQDLL